MFQTFLLPKQDDNKLGANLWRSRVESESKIKYSPHLLTHLQCKPIKMKSHELSMLQSIWLDPHE